MSNDIIYPSPQIKRYEEQNLISESFSEFTYKCHLDFKGIKLSCKESVGPFFAVRVKKTEITVAEHNFVENKVG